MLLSPFSLSQVTRTAPLNWRLQKSLATLEILVLCIVSCASFKSLICMWRYSTKTKLELQQFYAQCQNTRAGVTACIDSGHNPRIVQDHKTTLGPFLKFYITVDQSKIMGIYNQIRKSGHRKWCISSTAVLTCIGLAGRRNSCYVND